MMRNLKRLKQLKEQDTKMVALALLLIIGIPLIYVGAQVSLTQYYIFDELTLTLEVYGDDSEGVIRLIDINNPRIYTVARIDVVADHTDGLDYVRASLHYDDNGVIGERLATVAPMPEVVAQRFRVDFDVNGFATGYYWICISAAASTHEETWTNPDYTVYWKLWDEMGPEEQEAERDSWPAGPEHPDEPVEFISGQKNDVGIVIPADRRVSIKNPDVPMQVSFTMTKIDGTLASGTIDYPVKFDFDVIEGLLDHYVFVIKKDGDEVVRLSAPDLDTFVFNEGGLQSDGSYKANIYFIAKPGWTGGNREIIFSVDNPDEITGVVEIYVIENGEWVIADYILKGDIKVLVHSVTGNPSEIGVSLGVTFDGQGGFYEYYLTWDETKQEYSVIINLQKIPNGLYDVVVYAIRAEDGATVYLAAWDFDSAGSGKVSDIVVLGLFMFGILVFAGVVALKKRNWTKQKRRRKL